MQLSLIEPQLTGAGNIIMANFIITSDFAQKFADFVYKTTNYHSIVCDTNGMIIGDSARTRIGVIHAGSKKINTTAGMKEIAITLEDAANNPDMKEGVNYAIMVGNEKIGTYGIAGKLEIVKPLVKIAAAIISSRLKAIRHQAAVEKAMDSVSSNVQQTVAVVQRISASATEQTVTTDHAVAVSQNASRKIQDTSQILDMSRTIALQTRLLGLNASIEAARAGIHGRSFSILAGEMQKLAQNSADATTKINKILTETQEAIQQVTGCIEQLAALSSEQRQAMQNIIQLINYVQSATLDLVDTFR